MLYDHFSNFQKLKHSAYARSTLTLANATKKKKKTYKTLKSGISLPPINSTASFSAHSWLVINPYS